MTQKPQENDLLTLTNVELRHQNRVILDNINLTISRGEIITLIGPNGAGKSSLVRLIVGLLQPTKGKIWRQKRLKIGYMPQSLSIDQTLPLTVGRFLEISARADPSSIKETLEIVGATSLLKRSFHVLSGGERQRVLLARALLTKPQILVLDEPVQGIDISSQKGLYQLIARVCAVHQCAVFMVSHELHMVFASSTQIICLNKHICCAGKPEKVIENPKYKEIFGQQGLDYMALYTHDHDHQHDAPPDESLEGHSNA